MNQHEPELMSPSSHLEAMSWFDHPDAYSIHIQEAPTTRAVGDDGRAYVTRGQATSAGVVKSIQAMGGCLFLKHDDVPRHYSPGVATTCKQCIEDNGVRKQTVDEHPPLEQARSSSRRVILHAQLHCIFDLSVKGEYRASAKSASGW